MRELRILDPFESPRAYNRWKSCDSGRNWKQMGLTQDLESSRSSYLSSRKIKSAGRPRVTEYRSTRRTKSRTDYDSYIVTGGLMVVAATRGGHMLTTFRLFLRLFFYFGQFSENIYTSDWLSLVLETLLRYYYVQPQLSFLCYLQIEDCVFIEAY